MHRRAWTTLLTTGVVFLAGACGDGPFGASGDGRIEAEVHDAPDGAPAFTGTAAGDYSVAIRSVSGTWVELGSPDGSTVGLQSASATTIHGERSVPADRYDRVRLTLSDVAISVDAGGQVGGTVLINDESTMVADAAPLVLEISVPAFEIPDSDDAVRLSFDLNAETWITGQSFDVGVVPGSTVEGRVSVGVTGG